MFKQNMTKCLLFSLFLIMFISLRNRNITLANILTCFNGQELIKDESGNVVDWTNKKTDINKHADCYTFNSLGQELKFKLINNSDKKITDIYIIDITEWMDNSI